MMLMVRLFVSLGLLAALVSTPATALTYYSEQNLPFNGVDEQGHSSGFSVELLRLMWQELGQDEAQIQFLPWSQAWYLLTQQPDAVLLTTARTLPRAHHLQWVCPISRSRIVLMARADHLPQIRHRADLLTLKIGAMQADVGEQLLLNRGMPPTQLMTVPRMDLVVRQLLLSRTDLVAGNETMLRYQIRQLGYPAQQFVTVAVLAEQDNCFAFNPAVDPAEVALLQQALDKVRQGPAFQALQTRYKEMLNQTADDALPNIE
ncbi:substrate-binding periplasmic protein [Aeromonas molluscorum]|uniref:substrate-binding periplasmic protein n=1 Tax=Aeromonas molluscorum TaxID=271417 RepID=UPI003F1C0B03